MPNILPISSNEKLKLFLINHIASLLAITTSSFLVLATILFLLIL
ncbi:hypothetical protein CP02DC21_1464, partial [Chlamydia psittaci 02DC21]